MTTTTTPPRELWAEPTPQQPSLEHRRQAIELVYGVGAHTAHITAVRLEWAQQIRGN